MKLLVVILNYKVADLTINCLQSLSEQMRDIPGSEVVVVENGSGDDSGERLRQAIEAHKWDDWVELVALSQNLGYTRGNNLIVR